MTAAIAFVHLEHHPHGGVWVLNRCPICDRVHRHGGGGAADDSRDFLGQRQAQCVPGDVPPGVDCGTGYVLVEFIDYEKSAISNTSPDLSGSGLGQERVCVPTRPDATPEPGPGAGTQTRPDGPAGRSEARQRRRSQMSALKLSDAAGKLVRLGVDDLKWVYKKLVGDVPKGATTPGLRAAVAAALQNGAAGEGENAVVNDAAAEALAGVGEGKPAPARVSANEPVAAMAPPKPAKAKKEKAIKLPKPPKERDSRLPAPGSTITKAWRDQTIEVLVNETDFSFAGKPYRSLSKIASELLGCPSNGFLFFGLTEGAKAAAARRAEREATKSLAQDLSEEAHPEKRAKKPAKAGKSKTAKKSKAKSK